MKPIDTFAEIIRTKTRDGFHDATLLGLSVELDAHALELRIGHARDTPDGNERWIASVLRFDDVADLKVERVGDAWGLSSALGGDEIGSFDVLDTHGRGLFELVGIRGWRVSYTASVVCYAETTWNE